ncbi:MAG: 16S rRNA (guanine(966)-N(2))-methyltransferase RsmD [Holosporaceae bacterium]|jgi:16S rRNA (guanine(966)-N(2))-methyltransferase RsmD|nr:16S rRNA (guanine(966)-N(2))-methyltransferase RsmD [Holosporaceae bacterium]
MSIRIIAGKYRGLSLAVPISVRPTLSRYRQSLFDILEAMSADKTGFFVGKTVLDCFAGSGAFGIEAISRGAGYAYFVDSDRKTIAVINENLKKLKIESSFSVICADARSLKRKCRFKRLATLPSVDLVFLDPPYGKESVSQTLKHLLRTEWISESSIIVTEESAKKTEFLNEYFEITSRTYGDTVFKIWRTNLNFT